MRRLSICGPWGAVFTALLVIGVCTGCRQSAPPALPRQGWVQLAVLLPLYPDRRMVADLDHQVASLLQQRAHLLAQPALALPEGDVMPPRPLPALQPPEPPALPEPPPAATVQRTDAALAQDQAYRWQREYLRQKRDKSTQNAAHQPVELAELTQAAAVSRRQVEEKYLTSCTNALIRYNLAVTQLKAAQEYYTGHPLTLDGKKNVNAERNVIEWQKRLQTHKTEMETLEQALDGEKQAIGETLLKQEAYAKAENQRALTDELATLRTTLSGEAKQQAAAERQLLDTGIVAGQEVAPPEPVTFPELPGEVMPVGTRDVAAGIYAANHSTRQDTDTALQVIDRTIAQLRLERKEVLTAMTREVQSAAYTVAAQHGCQLSFTARRGENLTASVRRWLQEYWPLERERGR